MKLDVYKQVFRINAAFDQVLRSLVALKKYSHFDPAELTRFRRYSKENRAALNSYLTATMESAETEEAGRRFHQRLAQERSDELGSES